MADDNDRREVWSSYSGLTLHRNCPQRWYYKTVRHLEPLSGDRSPELDFGTWWHALRAAEAISRGRALGSLRYCPEKLRVTDNWPAIPVPEEGEEFGPDDVLSACREWWASQTPEEREESEGKLELPIPVGLERALERWRARWAEDIAREHPLAVEMKWSSTIPIPGDALPTDPVVMLTGQVDEVYLDTRRNMVVIRDSKTAKYLSSQSALDDLLDSQVQIYAWGINSIVSSWGYGPVRATAYDRISSVAPKPPRLTAQGRLAVVEGQPSIASTDLATYLEWVKGPDGEGVPWGEEGAYFVSGAKKGQPKFGHYTTDAAVLERLRSPAEMSRWHQRTLVPLSRSVVTAHLRAALDSGQDIARTLDRGRRTGGSVQRNYTRNCAWCPFAALCRAELFGGLDDEEGTHDLAALGLRERPSRHLLPVPDLAPAYAGLVL